MPKKPTPKRRLKNLWIGELSLVDSPAVGQSFLVAKRFDESEGLEPGDEETLETLSIQLEKATQSGEFWLHEYAQVKYDLEKLKATSKGI